MSKSEFGDFYEQAHNMALIDCYAKAGATIPRHRKITVSVSGGSDSDIVIDIVERTKTENQDVKYVWFNTGLEYQATKDQLKYLEDKYGIEIQEVKAQKPIPTCVRKYGVPFLSKRVSEMLWRLQTYDFKFEDKPFEELAVKYPKCKSALKWWCNSWGKNSHFNINRNKWLKEFLILNPPDFLIANKCCTYAKKNPGKQFAKDNDADLNVIGVRKAEGGTRATAYKNCYTENFGKASQFRPIFWLTDGDKKDYEKDFGITHSACYTKYGLKRTGCVGCPYGRNIDEELAACEKYEPKLYKACIKIFGKSYEYTKKYREFCKKMNYEANQDTDQLTLFDMFYDYAE